MRRYAPRLGNDFTYGAERHISHAIANASNHGNGKVQEKGKVNQSLRPDLGDGKETECKEHDRGPDEKEADESCKPA